MDDDEDDINKSKITFRTHFVTFVSQAITGVIFPFYKNITDDGTFESFSKSFCINKFHDLNVSQLIFILSLLFNMLDLFYFALKTKYLF